MLNWLQPTWYIIRSSLWLIPSVMVVAGGVLAFLLLGFDAGRGPEEHVRAWWVNAGSGDDARNLLSTLLASLITMASMVFSVTVVALTLAANSYGPRLIRIFRADVRTQVVLGLFVMTIVYCLLVLRAVRGGAPEVQVPHTSVTVGTAMALVCVLALLVFIHGVARLIVADEVVRRARQDLEYSVAQLPELEPTDNRQPACRGADSGEYVMATPIALPREGYVESVDFHGLVRWAERRKCKLWLEFRPGNFVVEGDHRVRIHPPTDEPETIRIEVGRYIVSGEERTPTQDLEFSIRHLVEVAVRALSPGVNDPFTATVVIDRLRGSLSRLMGRRLPAPVMVDRTGTVRLYRPVSTYGGLLDAAFNQIRHAGSKHPVVIQHLLDALARIHEHVRIDEQREALLRHADMARTAGLRDASETADGEAIERSYRQALEASEVAEQEGGA